MRACSSAALAALSPSGNNIGTTAGSGAGSLGGMDLACSVPNGGYAHNNSTLDAVSQKQPHSIIFQFIPRKLWLQSYKFAHLTCILLHYYLGKCKVIFKTVLNSNFD